MLLFSVTNFISLVKHYFSYTQKSVVESVYFLRRGQYSNKPIGKPIGPVRKTSGVL